MKYCVDCKWMIKPSFWQNHWVGIKRKCLNEGARIISGDQMIERIGVDAGYERSYGNCGPEGKLWEEKP